MSERYLGRYYFFVGGNAHQRRKNIRALKRSNADIYEISRHLTAGLYEVRVWR